MEQLYHLNPVHISINVFQDELPDLPRQPIWTAVCNTCHANGFCSDIEQSPGAAQAHLQEFLNNTIPNCRK